MTNLPANVKVIYHFMANMRTACRNFIIACADVVVIADIVLIVNSHIKLCSGFGCKNSSKMTTFRPKFRILRQNTNFLELLNPEK